MRDLRQQECRTPVEHKLAGYAIGLDTLKSPRAVVQPDDDVVRMNEVGPDEIVVAVIVYVVGEKRAAFFGTGVEVKNRRRLCLAEVYIDALPAAR